MKTVKYHLYLQNSSRPITLTDHVNDVHIDSIINMITRALSTPGVHKFQTDTDMLIFKASELKQIHMEILSSDKESPSRFVVNSPAFKSPSATNNMDLKVIQFDEENNVIEDEMPNIELDDFDGNPLSLDMEVENLENLEETTLMEKPVNQKVQEKPIQSKKITENKIIVDQLPPEKENNMDLEDPANQAMVEDVLNSDNSEKKRRKRKRIFVESND